MAKQRLPQSETSKLKPRGKPFTGADDPRRNKNGRPPRKSMTAHLIEAATDDARRKIVDRVVGAAKMGDLRAIEFVFQRLDGNVAQKIDIAFVLRLVAEKQGIPPDDPRVAAAIAEAEAVMAEARG